MKIFELFGEIILKDNDVDKKLDQVDQKGKKANGVLSKLSGIASKVGIGIAAVGTAAVGAATAIGVGAFNASQDLQKSLNGLQASTGATDSAMKEMKQSMLDIYNNNFGESFEDIGKSMQTINQQTGATGKTLTQLTQNAIALRDTFDFEVNESIRSSNMLMTQFGISGTEAYNLIAQGAQKGLDKNGDLLDTINEYSVHFKQLGFNSTEMFNMLVNGAKSGTFSVDKLGDAIKEFGIRSKDGSDTTKAAFQALKLDANKVSMDFAKGGEVGKKAFEDVTKKLLEMKDPLLQNQIGVALFGTMWEDLGVKGVEALTNTQGEISNTVNALNQINQVKYDTFGEAMEGIKRQLVTGIFMPLGDMILPKLNEFSVFINTNMPAIQGVLSTVFGTIGTVISNVSDTTLPPLQQGFNIFTTEILPPLIDVFGTITNEVFPALQSVFSEFMENILPVFIDLFKGIAEAVIPPVVDILKFLYSEIVPALYNTIGKLIPPIGNIFKNLKDVILEVINLIVERFKIAWPIISGVVKTAVTLISDVLGGLVKILDGIISFITGVFTGNWGKAWDGVKKIFSGIFDGIVGILKGAVNLIIDGINFLISGLNMIKVPEVYIPGLGTVGGWGFDFDKIPKLATGTDYVPQDMLAVIHQGEQIVPKKYNPNNPNNINTNKGINNHFNIASMIVREEADIKKIAQELYNLQNKNSRGRGILAT